MKHPRKKWEIWSVDILAYLLIIIFIALFIFLSIGKHNSLKSFQNDLGVYSQVTWNNLHGNFFESSGSALIATVLPNNTTDEHHNFLSGHFSPILFFFVPFYALWADPKIFLIIQAIAVGLGALPIYWLARQKIKLKWAGPAFLISYFSYPILNNALLYDFHEVTFAVPIVTFALWFMHKKRTGWMLFFLALLMLVQEHTSLIVFMFGLYLAFRKKNWKLGLILAATSFTYFLITMLVIIPSFSASGESVLVQGLVFETRYQWLGSSMQEIIKNIITKPVWVLSELISAKRIDFLVTMLLPLIGLPLLSSIFLLSLPVLVIYFLSDWMMTYTVYYYHSSILAGIFYFSAVFVFARFFQEKKWQRIFLGLILISSLIFSYIYSVAPWGKDYTWQDYRPSNNARLVKEVKKVVPPAASLSVQHNLGPHFSTRRKLFHFPFMLEKVDYVVVDVFNPYADNPKSYFDFGDVTEINYDAWESYLKRLLIHPDFGVIYSKEGWLVFKRGAPRDLNEQAIHDFNEAIKGIEVPLSKEERFLY